MTGPRGLYRFRRPTRPQLAALLDRASGDELAYDDVGATASASLSSAGGRPGFHELRLHRRIGQGAERFDEAKAAIRDWAGHRRAGVVVQPEVPSLEVGNDVAMALRVWPLWVTATCRIVRVVDEADRFGFAYGTLPHHPEAGEELFVATRDPSTGEVALEIVAFSRATSRLAALGGPAGRVVQRVMAGWYLDGFEFPTPGGDQRVQGWRPVASFRWWFQNRQTGRITVAQFPNWPLFAIAGATAVRWLAKSGSAVADTSGLVASGLWLYWAGDELVRGVNPWRRLIGASVIGWQLIRVASGLWS